MKFYIYTTTVKNKIARPTLKKWPIEIHFIKYNQSQMHKIFKYKTRGDDRASCRMNINSLGMNHLISQEQRIIILNYC